MNRLLHILKKEWLLIWRDKRSLFILIAIPMALILIFGYAVTLEIKKADIAILDRSDDRVTRGIITKIEATGFFESKKLKQGQSFERIFQQGQARAILVFEQAFAEKLRREGKATVFIIADATEPNVATSLISYLTQIIRGFAAPEWGIPRQASPLIVRTSMHYNAQLRGSYLFVPGLIAIILMLLGVTMTATALAREKTQGSLDMVLVSPLPPLQLILGKLFPYAVLSLIHAVMVLLMGYFVFEVPIRGNLLTLGIVTLIFIANNLSFGMLISSFTNSQQSAFLMANIGLILPSLLLSGYMFPVESMPEVLQWLSHGISVKWFIIIIRNILLKGNGWDRIWLEALILLGMTAFFLTASLWRYGLRRT